MKLSILIPIHNEAGLFETVLAQVHAVPEPKEIIIVDDGSTDGSTELIRREAERPGVKALFHEHSRGKGAAIHTGLRAVTGEVVIIQDCDLEYDPQDIPAVIRPIVEGRARVAYGSRFLGKIDKMAPLNWLANKLFVWTTRLLYGATLTDEATAYKAFAADLICRMPLRGEGFEFCSEATGMALRLGEKIAETPIHYRARSYDEGKKIGWRDFYPKMKYLVAFRFRTVKLLDQPVNRDSMARTGD